MTTTARHQEGIVRRFRSWFLGESAIDREDAWKSIQQSAQELTAAAQDLKGHIQELGTTRATLDSLVTELRHHNTQGGLNGRDHASGG